MIVCDRDTKTSDPFSPCLVWLGEALARPAPPFFFPCASTNTKLTAVAGWIGLVRIQLGHDAERRIELGGGGEKPDHLRLWRARASASAELSIAKQRLKDKSRAYYYG